MSLIEHSDGYEVKLDEFYGVNPLATSTDEGELVEEEEKTEIDGDNNVRPGLQRGFSRRNPPGARNERFQQFDGSATIQFNVQVIKFPLDLVCVACRAIHDVDVPAPPASLNITSNTAPLATSVEERSWTENVSSFFLGQSKPEVCLCAKCKIVELSKKDIEESKKQVSFFNESRKVVECRRIYLTDGVADLSSLEAEIDNGSYENRAFIVNNNDLFGKVLYLIESISRNPDKSYILTMSAGCYTVNREWHKELAENLDVPDLNVRMIHRMIPDEVVLKGLRSLPFIKEEMKIEVAANHPHLFFSRMDAVYTQWESSSNDLLPRRTTYKLVRPAENCSSLAVSGAIHILHKNVDNGKMYEYEKQTATQTDQNNVTTEYLTGPLILVAWNNSSTFKTECLCLYNLLNKKFLIRYNLPELTQNLEFLVKDRSEAKVALTKVAHITSSYADQKHILYVGFDYFDEDGTICGSFTSVFEISDNDIDYASKNSPGKDDAGKEKNESKYPTMVKKIPMDAPISLHDHQLTCLHLDRKGKTLLSGSYDKTFSISNLDNKFAMARDMEDRLLIEKPIKKLLAPTHVDTVLAVAPSDVPYAMFTSSSDATIRYWKKLVNKKLWTSYQFPLDHVKRVGCLAFAVISFHKKDNDADKTSKPQTLESRFVECLKTLQCEDNNDEPLKKELTGKILISGSLDHRVIVWDVNNPVKPIVAKYLVGHEDEVISVKVMNEPFPTVVSAGRDRMIRFWDLLSGDCFRKLDHASMINELDLVRVYRVGGDKTLRHSTDCDLGEVVAISSEQGVICWSFLSNHRMNVQYSDPVVSLASFPSENSNPLVFLGTSTSEIVISNDSIRVGEVKLTTFPNPQASNERFQKDKVRVNSLLSVEFPQGKGKFLLAGLANGFLSIVKVTGNELKEIAFFNTTMKNIFSLTQGIFRWKSNNSTTVIRNLLFIGGMADKEGNTLQVWDLKKLLTEVEETDDVSKEIDYDEALKARKVDFPHLKDPVYNIAVHAMNSMIVTADEARNVIVWRVYPNVEFKPLYSLEGLHTSHAIMNLQIFNPCLAWESAATGGKKGYLRNVEWQIEYTDEDNEVKYEKYNLAECDLVFTSGYDGKIGVWPIKLRDPPIPTSTQSTPVVNGSPTRGVGFTLPSKSSSVSVKLNAMSRSQSQILPPEPPSPADGSKPSYVTLSTKCTDDRYYYLAKPFNSMQHDNAQGVTSMIIFAPQGGENINPLLLTGSIDNFIYVWDVYTQEKLRVLTCHSNRVNSLLTYYADGKNSVVLVSGSDDGSAVFWKDGLQHHLFPPSKHSIARSFYNDVLTPGCWQHIKALKATCETLFWEFPHLFYLALIERQETFFIEFIEDLKQVITRIPGYPRSEGNNCCRWMHHVPEGPVDILEYAMHTNALVALRAILLAWIHVLNKDIDDSLNQSVLVATRTFNEKNLLELATNFPVEYTEFLTSLRLIRAHRTAPSVADNLIRVIPHGKRLVVVGSNSFPLDKQFRKEQDPHRKTFTSIFEEINTKYYQQSKFPQGREFCGLLKDLNTVWLRSVSSVLTEIYDRWMAFKAFAVHGKEVHEQAVMPFMIPIKRFVDIRQFHSAIQTSEILKRMDLFESDIVLAAITHYWNVYGWKIYMLNFIQYAFTIFMFVYSIYSYQRVVHMDRPNEEDLSRSLAATGGFMFFMTWYAIDEFFQVAGKFIKFHKYNLSNRRGFHIVVQHFFFDMWNVIDCSVVICGLMGASGLYKELKFCQDENHYVTSTTGGSPYCDVSRQSTATMSCLLAATAVLLWFKVLYYLRPSKEAGQFVAMVMLIMNDIKYFLLVLVCVLVGFAQGFWLLLNNADPSSSFTSVKQSYFTTFMFMLGEINQDDIDHSKASEFTKFFLVAFMITMLILMFNLLIALMGDSFDRTKENIEAHYWQELVSFMVDQSMPTPFVFILQLFGVMKYEKDEYVHVVKYASDVRISGSNFDSNRRDDNDDTPDEADCAHEDTERFVKKLSPLERSFNISAKLMKSSVSERQQLKLSKKSFVDDDIIDRKNLRVALNTPLSTNTNSLPTTV